MEAKRPALTIAAVVLDIEGTTTPISFVADVLFPYIRRELRNYLTQNWTDAQLQQDVQNLRALAVDQPELQLPHIPHTTTPTDGGVADDESVREAVVRNVTAQMDRDLKTTALKGLQGHMWVKGYSSGELKGEVYDDVIEALDKLGAAKLPVYIYSSGSVQAQKLLFGYSSHGDMLPRFKGHYDTTIGLKVEEASYHAIAKEIGQDAPHILFVTDNILEAYAAQKAGWNVAVTDRPGNKPLPEEHPFPVVQSFMQLWKVESIVLP
eukprot:TRINITY_DN1733_c0_g1_i1.p1 TRINITY_DN1733_c0_g1~~TRINITY_DN1733_c0_g1_i1.p1  ORF type:complete len:276 (+),score=61.06 TRINITY_DN1733_c0_g1_i1:35-829(+)